MELCARHPANILEPSPDLTAARAAWRDALLSRESLSPVQLRELEAHLDDSMDELSARGLSADEAFLIATRRLGAPEPLAAEFRKAGGESRWAGRARWMLLGMVVYLAAVAVAQVAVSAGILALVLGGTSLNDWRAHVPDAWPALGAVAVGAGVAAVCGIGVRGVFVGWLRGLPDWMRRRPVRVLGIVLAFGCGLPSVIRFSLHLWLVKNMESSAVAYYSQLVWMGMSSCMAVFFVAMLVGVRRYWQPDRLALASH